jgi:hypothetical protein
MNLPENRKIQEFNLVNEIGEDYWHCCIQGQNPLDYSAAGFSRSKNLARSIAYSEFLERSKFIEIKQLSVLGKSDWGLDLIPTGCGFAGGFNLRNAVIRSIGESLERWCMSKWVDEKYYIEKLDFASIKLDSPSKWFCNQFESVDFYKLDTIVEYGKKFFKFTIFFTICFINKGAFPGCSFTNSKDENWQHALLESFRHLLVVKNSAPTNTFPDNRIRYFSINAEKAIQQIPQRNEKKDWPYPKIIFHNFKEYKEEKFFLARTIVDGWTSWNKGPIERFVY